MKVALLGYGTRGDFQPVLAVADALKRRGHDVRLTVNVSSARWASPSGIDLVPMQPDIEAFFKSPGGKRLLASGRVPTFVRELAQLEREHNADLIRAYDRACQGADLILSTILTAFRAATLERVLDLPHVCLTTMPLMCTGAFASYLTPVRDFRLAWLNRLSWNLFFSAYWIGQKAVLNAARHSAGLSDWPQRPRLELGNFIHMYSRHLVPFPEDVPATHWPGGHPTLSPELRRRLGEGAPPPELDAWLDAGPAPVFFGFGSMPVLDPGALLRVVTRLCKEHSIRALIGAGWSEYATSELPDDVFIAPAFDHDRVLPRCRAAVHHGGAGTTHAGLRAGLPTLICSLFGDQPFWGDRVARLGAGTTFRFQQLDQARLSAALDVLMHPTTVQRAQQLGEAMRGENAAERIAELVERFAVTQGISLANKSSQAIVA